MSDMTIKTIIAVFFLIAATGAFLTMMTVMGKPERTGGGAKLRRAHKVFGWFYVALLVPLAYFGIDFVLEMGDGLSTRGVFHLVLAMTLVTLLLFKLLAVKSFRGLVKNAPAVGMGLFMLTLVVFLITAGFYVLQIIGAD